MLSLAQVNHDSFFIILCTLHDRRVFLLQVHVSVPSPSLRCKYGQLCAMRKVYAACFRLGRGQPTLGTGVISTVVTGGSTIYRHATTNAISAWTTFCASTDARHLPPCEMASRHCLCVFESCQLLSLYPIDVTWSRDSEHQFNQSAGSTRMRGRRASQCDWWLF